MLLGNPAPRHPTPLNGYYDQMESRDEVTELLCCGEMEGPTYSFCLDEVRTFDRCCLRPYLKAIDYLRTWEHFGCAPRHRMAPPPPPQTPAEHLAASPSTSHACVLELNCHLRSTRAAGPTRAAGANISVWARIRPLLVVESPSLGSTFASIPTATALPAVLPA